MQVHISAAAALPCHLASQPYVVQRCLPVILELAHGQ